MTTNQFKEQEPIEKFVANRLRYLRTWEEITLKELKKRTNLSQPSLSEMERGILTPSLKTLGRICEAYRVPLSDFFKDY